MTDTHLAVLLDRFVRRIHVDLRRKAPEFDTERIGPGGAIILLTLDETGETPMQVLAERLVRDKSQMTRSIRMLEEKGLVRRRQCASDCRVSLISLTDSGDAVVATHQRVIAETIDALLAPLSDEGARQLREQLALAMAHDAIAPPD